MSEPVLDLDRLRVALRALGEGASPREDCPMPERLSPEDQATVDSSSYTCQAVAAPANDQAEHTLHAMLLTAGCAQWRETGRQTLRRDLEQRDRVGQAVQAVGAKGDEPHAGW